MPFRGECRYARRRAPARRTPCRAPRARVRTCWPLSTPRASPPRSTRDDVEVRRGPDGAQLADDVRVAERSQQVDLEAHPRSDASSMPARYLLIATTRPSRLSIALYTCPYAPLPISSPSISFPPGCYAACSWLVSWGRGAMSALRANSIQRARRYGVTGKGRARARTSEAHCPGARRVAPCARAPFFGASTSCAPHRDRQTGGFPHRTINAWSIS